MTDKEEHEFGYDPDLNDAGLRYIELTKAIKVLESNETLKAEIKCILIDNMQEEIEDIENFLNEIRLN